MSLKKALKIIGTILFIGIIYIAISFSIDMFRHKPISLCGYNVSYVPTESMEPTIKAKSYVLVKETKNVKVGDIVVYKSNKNNMYIIHRIININNGVYTFQGDNNPAIDDEDVSINQIYGVYIKDVYFLTKLISGDNRMLFFGIIVVIFVLMFVLQLINALANYKKEKNKNDNLQKLKREIYLEELKKLEDKEK